MTKKTTRRQLDVGAYNDFVGRFHDESDRAAAVLAGGYLDAFLESALRSVLTPGGRTDDLFDARGVLQSFAAKIGLSFSLGIVTEPLARDMDLVRKVRNYFAHHVWEASFDSSPVCDWCSQIGVVDSAIDSTTKERVKDENPARLRYLLAVGLSTLQIAHSPRVPDSFRQLATGVPPRGP